MKALRRLLGVLVPLALGGCQAFNGLSNTVGSLLATVIALAVIAIPFVLAYYAYKHQL